MFTPLIRCSTQYTYTPESELYNPLLFNSYHWTNWIFLHRSWFFLFNLPDLAQSPFFLNQHQVISSHTLRWTGTGTTYTDSNFLPAHYISIFPHLKLCLALRTTISARRTSTSMILENSVQLCRTSNWGSPRHTVESSSTKPTRSAYTQNSTLTLPLTSLQIPRSWPFWASIPERQHPIGMDGFCRTFSLFTICFAGRRRIKSGCMVSI